MKQYLNTDTLEPLFAERMPTGTSFGFGDDDLDNPMIRSSSAEQLQAKFTHDVDELAKEFHSMSFQKRVQIQEEVHGVGAVCPDETPEMMDQALQSMQEHLNDIWYKPIYDKVSPSSYIHTKEFRLRFLRCELYECKKAAERLVRYTNFIYDEYDMEVLERPLRLSDLENKTGKKGKDTMKLLRAGHAQILPFRDKSGRLIYFLGPAMCNHKADVTVSLLALSVVDSLDHEMYDSHSIIGFCLYSGCTSTFICTHLVM